MMGLAWDINGSLWAHSERYGRKVVYKSMPGGFTPQINLEFVKSVPLRDLMIVACKHPAFSAA